jgi:hypothetical protein
VAQGRDDRHQHGRGPDEQGGMAHAGAGDPGVLHQDRPAVPDRALPQITAADNVAGEMDYLLAIVARDVAELQQVLARLATRGGQRLVTYLRLEEIKPPSPLPLTPTPPPPSRTRRAR